MLYILRKLTSCDKVSTLIKCVVFLATYLSNSLMVCHYQKGGDCWTNGGEHQDPDYVLIMRNVTTFDKYVFQVFLAIIMTWCKKVIIWTSSSELHGHYFEDTGVGKILHVHYLNSNCEQFQRLVCMNSSVHEQCQRLVYMNSYTNQ